MRPCRCLASCGSCSANRPATCKYACAIAAASAAALAYLPLITGILTGRAREDRLSWVIWAAQYALLFAVQSGRGGGPLLALIGAGTVGCLLTCALTLWRGTGRCSPARIAVLLGALAAWRCTCDPSVAFGLLVAVEAAATIPTIRNAYRTGAEPAAYWLLIALAALLEIPALALGRYPSPPLSYAFIATAAAGATAVLAATTIGRHLRSESTSQPEASICF